MPVANRNPCTTARLLSVLLRPTTAVALTLLSMTLLMIAARTHAGVIDDGRWLILLTNTTPRASRVCLTSWDPSHPERVCSGSWAGVTCNTGLSAVTSVQLGSCYLYGTLPPLTGAAMTALTQLDLNRNSLFGSLPESWGGMSSLQTLDLSSNSFDSSLPGSWSSMFSLQSLYLPSNNFSGSIPAAWSSLPSLSSLVLTSNRLTGSLPASWSSMTSLRTLHFSTNKLFGELPASWSEMTSLNYFHLYNNSLTGSLPESWWNMSSLRNLDVGLNCLSGSLPASWSGTTITSVWGDSNYFTGTIPASWLTATAKISGDFSSNCLDPSVGSVSLLPSSGRHLTLLPLRSRFECLAFRHSTSTLTSTETPYFEKDSVNRETMSRGTVTLSHSPYLSTTFVDLATCNVTVSVTESSSRTLSFPSTSTRSTSSDHSELHSVSVTVSTTHTQLLNVSRHTEKALILPSAGVQPNRVLRSMSESLGSVGIAAVGVGAPLLASSCTVSALLMLQTSSGAMRIARRCSVSATADNTSAAALADDDGDAPGQSFMDNPLQLAIGESSFSSSSPYTTGCIVGNAVVVVTLCLLLAAGRVLFWRGDDDDRGSIALGFIARVAQHLPGYGYLALQLLMQPSVACSVRLFALASYGKQSGPTSPSLVAVGVFGVLVFVAGGGGCVIASLWCSRRASAEGPVPSLTRFELVLAPYQRERRWFCLVDFVAPLVCGVLSGLTVGGSSSGSSACSWVLWVTLTVCVLVLLGIAVFRPYLEVFDNAFAVVANALTIAVVALLMDDGSPTSRDAAAVVNTVLSWVCLLPIAVALFRVIKGWRVRNSVSMAKKSVSPVGMEEDCLPVVGLDKDKHEKCLRDLIVAVCNRRRYIQRIFVTDDFCPRSQSVELDSLQLGISFERR